MLETRVRPASSGETDENIVAAAKAGDAAAMTLAAGIWLEGVNFAIGSGYAAGRAVDRAVASGDCSAAGLSSYRTDLEGQFVLADHKRLRKAPALVVKLQVEDMELDLIERSVRRNGTVLDLKTTEFRLLEYLLERPGRVFSRAQLLDGVWGSDVYIDERTVDVHVGRLRKALNRGHAVDPIRTVRGAGYSLDDRFGKAS